jgi:hypothetical protein
MIKRRYPKYIYATFRLGEALLSAGSRFWNKVRYDGSTNQSVSARAWIDGIDDPEWLQRRRRIDAFFRFFGQKDHCRKYYLSEIEAARKTLLRAGLDF